MSMTTKQTHAQLRLTRIEAQGRGLRGLSNPCLNGLRRLGSASS